MKDKAVAIADLISAIDKAFAAGASTEEVAKCLAWGIVRQTFANQAERQEATR